MFCIVKPSVVKEDNENSKKKRRNSAQVPTTHWSRLRLDDVRTTCSGSLYSNVIMAALDVIVDSLVAFWKKPAARQNIHWIFLLIAIVGSVAKELGFVPQTYFSSSRNVVNV